MSGAPTREIRGQTDRHLGRYGGHRCRRIQFSTQCFGFAANQPAEFVNTLGDLRFQRRQRCASRVSLRRRVAHVNISRQARRLPLARQIKQFFDRGKILFGHSQPYLCAAQFEIGLRDIA